MSREIFRTQNFVQDAADLILKKAREALAQRGEFRIALSGGNTPRPVYTQFAQAGSDLPWDKVLFTFGDERCVPPDDAQSNYRMAHETLFSIAAVPQKSILRMRGEIDPAISAQDYEAQLQERATKSGEEIFRHDLILLGMGDDGHTASLFPGTAALEEKSRTVVENFVPKLEAWRLTFTLPLINAARHVCFLVDARKQSALIEKVLQGDTQYPSARVRPAPGTLTWILGEAA